MAIYGCLLLSGLLISLLASACALIVCLGFGSATPPGTSHYIDCGKGMLRFVEYGA